MLEQSSRLNVLLALDSFKGSITAQEACEAITRGLAKACSALHIDLHTTFLPVSDGGEGLIDCLVPTLERSGYSEYVVDIQNPHGKIVPARILLNLREHKALIESAEAIGLTLIPEGERTAIRASSFGLGQLIDFALRQGVSEINLGLGGTATNDCGIGMMQALGFRFFADNGQELGWATGSGSSSSSKRQILPLGAQDLALVAKIDDSKWQERVQALESQNVRLKVIGSCDVDNPLLGGNGATYVFGPQKGLTQANIGLIEQGMASFAACLTQHLGIDHVHTPGAGAAGGLGAALKYCFNAQLISGIDMVLQLQGIDEKLQQAHVVIVGEGCMDGQSIRGKAPVGVARYAAKYHVPCLALCGALKGEPSDLYAQHIGAMFSIAPGPISVNASMEQADDLLERTAENVGRCFLLGLTCSRS